MFYKKALFPCLLLLTSTIILSQNSNDLILKFAFTNTEIDAHPLVFEDDNNYLLAFKESGSYKIIVNNKILGHLRNLESPRGIIDKSIYTILGDKGFVYKNSELDLIDSFDLNDYIFYFTDPTSKKLIATDSYETTGLKIGVFNDSLELLEEWYPFGGEYYSSIELISSNDQSSFFLIKHQGEKSLYALYDLRNGNKYILTDVISDSRKFHIHDNCLYYTYKGSLNKYSIVKNELVGTVQFSSSSRLSRSFLFDSKIYILDNEKKLLHNVNLKSATLETITISFKSSLNPFFIGEILCFANKLYLNVDQKKKNESGRLRDLYISEVSEASTLTIKNQSRSKNLDSYNTIHFLKNQPIAVVVKGNNVEIYEIQ